MAPKPPLKPTAAPQPQAAETAGKHAGNDALALENIDQKRDTDTVQRQAAERYGASGGANPQNSVKKPG